MERKIIAIKEAGFEGFAWILNKEHGRLASKHGLFTIGFVSSARPAEFRSLIQSNIDGGAVRINVQLGNHDTPVREAIRMAIRIIQECEKCNIPCDIEVHRDTCTETPEKVRAIAAGFRELTGRLLPLTWDFSHPAVVKHLTPPLWERLIDDRTLVQYSRQFHFRPFNGHHCQIPVTDGTGALSGELRQWLPFLTRVIDTWLDADQQGKELFACPEMGPVRSGYNLRSLPNSWEDTKILQLIIEKTWNKALRARRKGNA